MLLFCIIFCVYVCVCVQAFVHLCSSLRRLYELLLLYARHHCTSALALSVIALAIGGFRFYWCECVCVCELKLLNVVTTVSQIQ